MTILQLPQGHRRDAFTGLTLAEAVRHLVAWDDAFLEKFPQCKPYHRPSWTIWHNVAETCRAPWGYEWHRVGEDGTLSLHSADYDSSG